MFRIYISAKVPQISFQISMLGGTGVAGVVYQQKTEGGEFQMAFIKWVF